MKHESPLSPASNERQIMANALWMGNCTNCGTKLVKKFKDVNKSTRQGKNQFCSGACASKYTAKRRLVGIREKMEKLLLPSNLRESSMEDIIQYAHQYNLPLSALITKLELSTKHIARAYRLIRKNGLCKTPMFVAGKQVGQMVITDDLGLRRYNVKCLLCLNTKEISYNDLNRAKNFNYGCGCRTRKPKENAALRNIYKRYKYSAISRKLEFALSLDEFKNICQQNCFYCKMPPSMVANNESRTAEPLKYNSLDRRDNAQGYTTSNCVPSCKRCNMAKGTDSEIEYRNWLTGVIERNRRE